MYIKFLVASLWLFSSAYGMEEDSERRLSDLPSGECSVCIEPLFESRKIPYTSLDTGKEVEKTIYKDDVIILRCGHSYHQRCLTGWSLTRSNCPVCRDQLKFQEEFAEKLGDRLYDSVRVEPEEVNPACGSPWAYFCGIFTESDGGYSTPPNIFENLGDS